MLTVDALPDHAHAPAASVRVCHIFVGGGLDKLAVVIDSLQQQRLVHLWNVRQRAGEAEWAELYRLIERALAKCGSNVLNALDADRTSLTHDFFYQKVFLTADGARAPLQHAGAVCGFFRNYLNDRWRAQAASTGRQVELDENRGSDGDGDNASSAALDAAHADGDHAYETVLVEAGVSMARMHEEVERFIDELAAGDDTYVLYLKLHLCPDEPVPLSRLAKLYAIPSYHYRAERLGITGRKGGFAKDYDQTLLGQWLVRLGLHIEVSYMREIAAAFAHLCAGALARLTAPAPAEWRAPT